MRIMGLDYGSKTVGVAVSDALLLTAQAVETICRTQENKLRKTLARIEELCREYEVERIVLGFPKNMNNTIGDRAEKSLEFAEMLKRRTGLPVVMWDERLTTVAAEQDAYGERRAQRKQKRTHRSDCSCIYPSGISGSESTAGENRKWKN